ncbi:hypothetical protein DXG03_007455 [Asterophora parasitica]|uniref:Uncharacterized protein n=1 Tax=Asterophora parasitica TaxID=117018 RepID=A0A9P7G7F4_9AGAR|nr:hypothetical protein DXG03_007455 [Asterophora parasitica]
MGIMTGADGGSVDISQDVTWTAKFVDKISEVTDSLNISGSLQIKCDAVGGGGKASAEFIDTNKFKESDINYLIQVHVTNQRLSAPDLTEFDPIPYVSHSDFTRVYGDSYISGFIEGGEFNALISIKLKDRSKSKQIKGELEAKVNFQAVDVGIKGKLDKTDSDMSIDGETTIAVSWKGGGDIKDGTVSDWTLETLKAVAMEFPEHVMACPMYTSAILTKYTSLKSFYEKSIRGSPLDYENAGVYSAALLDAYMDYKMMWRNIQQAAWEVEQGMSEANSKGDMPEFAELSLEAKANYDMQLKRYQLKVEQIEHARVTPPPVTVIYQNAVPQSAPSATAGNVVASTPPATDESVPTSTDSAADVPTSSSSTVAAPQPTVAATTEGQVAAPVSPPARTSSDVIHHQPTAQVATPVLLPRPLPEPPMPPNELVPYKGSIFGLDKARRDCRFEMIKIVREVDAVAEDPKVACDPKRVWQYLSPAVFRMLLPTVTNLNKERAIQLAAEEAKKATDAQMKEQEQLRVDLTTSRRKLEESEQQLGAVEKAKKEVEQQLRALENTKREVEQHLRTVENAKKEVEDKLRAVEAARHELNPYGGWCPVPVGTPVRIRSHVSRKCMDYDFSDGRGGKSLHQFDAVNNPNQRFEINAVGPKGFAIRHIASGRYLTTSSTADMRVYFAMGDFPTLFTFEARLDGNNWNGTVLIHIADQNQYTLNVENAAQHNGAKLIGWTGGKGSPDIWYIKGFDDMSI